MNPPKEDIGILSFILHDKKCMLKWFNDWDWWGPRRRDTCSSFQISSAIILVFDLAFMLDFDTIAI